LSDGVSPTAVEMRDTRVMRVRPIPSSDRPTAVVFDLGGVLIDWNPRHLYRQMFSEEAAMERFLNEVTTAAWNLEQDRGRSFADGIAELVRDHSGHADLIEAYWHRWPEMLGEPLPGTVEILAALRATGVRLLALSNWSAETFPIGAARYPFLAWFEAIVVSGEVGLVKPDPALFRLMIDRHGIEPASTVFIDDSSANVQAAAALGFTAIPFTGALELRRDLARVGLLSP
jgi:2-haloacid dehalogenase